jgi:hypothetical protein
MKTSTTAICFLLCLAATYGAIIVSTPLELDGDATTTTSHDWDQIDSTGSTLGATASRFFIDGIDQTSFTGGGSKDESDVPNWQYLNGNTPSKDISCC